MNNKVNGQDKERLIAEIQRLHATDPNQPRQTLFKAALERTGIKLVPNNNAVYRWLNHAGVISSKPARPAPYVPPMDRIRAAEKQIADAIRDLDVERNQLQARLVEIDNTVAHYKKIQRNGTAH